MNSPAQQSTEQRRIVIFDGVCIFCNGAVNFIIERDPYCKFVFAPMQSQIAQELIAKHEIGNVGIDTFLLVKDGKCFIWTNAALEIAKELNGYWYVFSALRIVPRPIRDWFYRLFARNRYRLFGRTDQCMVPSPELKERFIDAWPTRKVTEGE